MDASKEISASDSMLLFGMMGMLLLALLLVVLFLVYQRRIIRQQRLHQQKEAVHQQTMLRANIQSQEQERNRIGKDLHDDVGALLTTTKFYLDHLDQSLDDDKFETLKLKAQNLLSDSVKSIRGVSHDLRPVVLEQLGLIEAITTLVEQLQTSDQLEVKFTHDPIVNIDEEMALHWYRIVQELIANTLKHANASTIGIEITNAGQELSLKYWDDGIGLPDDGLSIAGLGLKNIESRISILMGKQQITNGPEKGFQAVLSGKIQAS